MLSAPHGHHSPRYQSTSCRLIRPNAKPENILCKDSLFDIKIGDFGLSKLVFPDEKLDYPCGTLNYIGFHVSPFSSSPGSDLQARLHDQGGHVVFGRDLLSSVRFVERTHG